MKPARIIVVIMLLLAAGFCSWQIVQAAVTPPKIISLGGYYDVKASDKLWHGHLILLEITGVTYTGSTILEGTTGNQMQDAALVLNATLGANRDIWTWKPWTGYPNNRQSVTKSQNPKIDFTTTNVYTLLPYLKPPDYNGNGSMDSSDGNSVIKFVRRDVMPAKYADGATTHWNLGAINNSRPKIISNPEFNSLLAGYTSFVAEHKDRPHIAYVGAADGMLHAFFTKDPDGTTGSRVVLEEKFGFIPYNLLKNLHYLKDGTQYQYVDASPSAADVLLNVDQSQWIGPAGGWGSQEIKGICAHHAEFFTTDLYCWRTVLMGGVGTGGKFVYALDITDVDSTAAKDTAAGNVNVAPGVDVLWEFTAGHLNNTFSRPVPMEVYYNESLHGNTATSLLMSVFGGGWSDPTVVNKGGYVYTVNMDTGQKIKEFNVPDPASDFSGCSLHHGCLHVYNHVVGGKLLDTRVQVIDSDTLNYNNVPTDLSVLDTNGDGLDDWIYFGDFDGRVWKMNLTSGNPNTWKMCLFWDTGDKRAYGATWFDGYDVSKIDANKRRPIYYPITVTNYPNSQNFLVYFATGHILTQAEARNAAVVNYVFAVKDSDTLGGCGYGQLFTQSNPNISGIVVPIGGSTIKFPLALEAGEKVISKPRILNGTMYFKTFVTKANNLCDPGSTRRWEISYLTAYGINNLGGVEGGQYDTMKVFSPGDTAITSLGFIDTLPSLPGFQLSSFPNMGSADILSWGENILRPFRQ